MSLSDWADWFTIAASLLAVVGVGWLVFVQIRRHKRVKVELKQLKAIFVHQMAVDEKLDAAIESAFEAAEPEGSEKLSRMLLVRLSMTSAQLMGVQAIGITQLARQHAAAAG